MGKLINNNMISTITHNNDVFRDVAENPISKILDNATEVTYYNKHTVLTTDDKFFSGQYGSMDKVFDKIDNMVLYLTDKISFDTEIGDFGLSSSYEGEAILAYNSIKPEYYDMFIISYLPEYIFRVIDVESPDITSNKFYKVKFEFYKTDYDLSRIKIANEYNFIFNNINSSVNSIILKSNYVTINKMDSIYEYLRSSYMRLFYDNNTNDFIFKDSMFNFVNPYANIFINELGLFDSDPDKYHIEYNFNKNDIFNDYRKSIYNAIVNRDINMLNDNCEFIVIENMSDRSILHSFDTHHILKLDTGESSIVKLSLKELHDNIKNCKCVDSSFENIIINYLTLDDKLDISLINSIDMSYDISSFIYGPLILGVIKRVSDIMIV